MNGQNKCHSGDYCNKLDLVCLLWQITNIGTTEFCQGKTMRWGLAWTFDPNITFPVRILCCCIQPYMPCFILSLYWWRDVDSMLTLSRPRPWERMPYMSTLEVCLWQGAIQIHVTFTVIKTVNFKTQWYWDEHCINLTSRCLDVVILKSWVRQIHFRVQMNNTLIITYVIMYLSVCQALCNILCHNCKMAILICVASQDIGSYGNIMKHSFCYHKVRLSHLWAMPKWFQLSKNTFHTNWQMGIFRFFDGRFDKQNLAVHTSKCIKWRHPLSVAKIEPIIYHISVSIKIRILAFRLLQTLLEFATETGSVIKPKYQWRNWQ